MKSSEPANLAFVLFMAWVIAWAQPLSARTQQAGEVSGAIVDQTGRALVGAAVTLRSDQVRDLRTDDVGRFAFRDLMAGDYELIAAAPGFTSVRRTVRLSPGEAIDLTFTMHISVLEQTVVTATKAGPTDIQSMPVAVSVVRGEELTRLAIRTVDQAAALMPSVTFTQNSTYGQLSIRGIGTNAVNAGSDPSAALYLDGVYLARPAMLNVDFLDLERVEVLRGPQGTLYGRNAVGGALNLISRSPSNEFDAAARVTVGNLDELRAEARVSGALRRDKVMGSVAFVRGRRDGYVVDLDHPDHPLGGDDLTAARAQLRVVLNRRTDLLLSTDLASQNGTLLTFNKILQVKPGFIVDNPDNLREVRTSTLASSAVSQRGVTARITSALTPATTLVSLTAFRQMANEFVADADMSELDVLATHIDERQHQFSQEVTVAHHQRRLKWVGGIFFFDEADHQPIWVDQPRAQVQVRLDPRVDSTSGAVFGEATVALTSRLSGILGLRYSRETKDIDNAGGQYPLDGSVTPVPGTVYDYTDAVTHTAWTPRFGFEFELSPRAMTYATASRGFKSGGFNPSSTQPGRGYAPEFAWSYEGGVKAGLMNGRTRVNLAAFHTDYTNLQVQTPIGIGVFDIRNAAAPTIRGLEVEGQARIGGGLAAGGHVAWLDATYDQYTAVGIGGVTGDAAGHRLNNAPEWSGRIWADWTRPIRSSSRLTITAEATGQSTVFYTPFNDAIQRQRPYGVLGARAEYGPGNRRWSVNAFARNLTDTDYIMATFATSPVAFAGRPGPSRQFGVQLVLQR